jgi:uncharacterized protein YjbI with pentapeptide repeats
VHPEGGGEGYEYLCEFLIHRGFIQHCYRVSDVVEKQGNQAAGEKQGRKPWTLREFGGKTLWDWMGLLIVPVVLSLITVVFALWQDARQDQIEQQRAEREQQLEQQREQAEALQAYLDHMTQLLLEKELRGTGEASREGRTIARARTLTVLERLNPSRKTSVLLFLTEANLIQGVHGDPIIPLFEANLAGAQLNNTYLAGADLHDANLVGADLSEADLRGADLYSAFERADLSEANLSNASLSDANLTGALLKNANLSGADLTNAQVSSEKQLEQATSLKGATMPNGQKYEDWLKSKNRKENGKNDGSS